MAVQCPNWTHGRRVEDLQTPARCCSDEPSRQTQPLAAECAGGSHSPPEFVGTWTAKQDDPSSADRYDELDDWVCAFSPSGGDQGSSPSCRPPTGMDMSAGTQVTIMLRQGCDALQVDAITEPQAKLRDLLPDAVVEELGHPDNIFDETQPFASTDKRIEAPPRVLSDGPEAATCIWFPGAAPFEAANRLVAAFRNERAVQITKVRPRKFSLSVAAYVDGGSFCQLKVFVYNVGGSAQCSVAEFQRRRGDCVAFHCIYSRLRAQLSLSSDGAPSEAAAGVGPGCYSLRALRLKGADVARMLMPLLDMARHAKDDEQQAEAAGALQAAVGEDAEFAENLSTPDFRAVLASLLAADAFCIAYPTARLIATLAQCPSAAHFFTDGVVPLARLMISKLEGQKMGAAANAELALALRRLAGFRHADVSTDKLVAPSQGSHYNHYSKSCE